MIDGSSDEAERSIVVTRTIEAPRRLVFLAYTSADHLGRWWGPDGFSTTTHAFEFRVGGVWSYTMHGPDGTDYPNWIEWREIVPPERIAYRHGEHADDPEMFEGSVTLVERGAATEITLRALFKTKRRRDEVISRYDALEGGRQTLGRLAAYALTLSKTGG
jgi:uncharacterized protein YndB with AHSA1/START domain